MTCNHCKASVENGLSKIPNVSQVVADPDKNKVVIEADSIDEFNIRETVEGLGYSFRGRA